jgi:Flp pilus assembly protein TadG
MRRSFATRRMPTTNRSSSRGRSGATAVEFSFIAPALFIVVFGMIELGRGIMVVHLLTNAARHGCRVGVLSGKGNSDIQTAVDSTLSPIGISRDTITVQVNDGTADASTAKSGDELTVKVSVPVASVTWLPGGTHLSGNLTGQYTLRRE